MDDSWFQIQEHRPGNVVIVICLVEKHILPVDAICGEILQHTGR